MDRKQAISALTTDWQVNPRWSGVLRPYSADKVVQLRGSLQIEHTLAKLGAEKLWNLFCSKRFVRAMGALTGNQAVQQVQAGLQAIYLSGWQVAADANEADQTYPDQSLYPMLSAPRLIRRIQNALQRADQIQYLADKDDGLDWYVPIVADAEAGFGGPLNAFELVKAMIIAGAAAIHLEDQLSSIKKCGHMGGKVLVPATDFIEKLVTARLAADVLGISTLLIARTDAESATFIRSDSDPIDQPFFTGKRSVEGYFYLKAGIEYAIARALAFAPYSDMIWCETSTPDLGAAREFAQGVHEKFPGKWLAYNCSPSFNWKRHLDDRQIGNFQEQLGDMGYKFQFITLAGFHTLNASMFELANDYVKRGMLAYTRVQQREQELESEAGYQALKHQSFVGAGYFDEVLSTITAGNTSTQALKGSTEEQQFLKTAKRDSKP